MEKIEGKVLVTTDWHIGLKQNSKSRLNIVIMVVKEILQHVKKNNIKTLIFAGDLFHERVSVNVNSLNVALKCISTLAKFCKIYLIVGNHDSHLKNSIDINSLNIFKDTPNVQIIDKPTQVSINGNKSILVPWLGDISTQEKEYFDMMFGHFDVSQKYLIRSYVEEHSNSTEASDNIESKLDADTTLTNSQSNVGDLVGDFVEIVKKKGIIFSGHIHGRKEFISRGRQFVLIGDPYQQNLGEKNYSCGFYSINEDNEYSFHPIDNVPKHVELYISKIAKNVDEFDYSCVSNNIIHKIYDIDIDNQLNGKICQHIMIDFHMRNLFQTMKSISIQIAM